MSDLLWAKVEGSRRACAGGIIKQKRGQGLVLNSLHHWFCYTFIQKLKKNAIVPSLSSDHGVLQGEK